MNNCCPKPKNMAMPYRALFRVIVATALLLAFTRFADSKTPTGITAVHYALTNGTKLTGYLSLPPEYQQGGRYPAILLLHGWRGVSKQRPQGLAESCLKQRIHQKYLCQKYVVFSGEYYANLLGDSREFDSMSAALKTMAALPQVDPQRIAVVGASHGGYLALMCMMNPDIHPKPKVGVDICGVVDVAAWAKYLRSIKNKSELLPGLRQFACTKVPEAFGWPPDKDSATKENYARISVLTYVNNLQGPILMIYNRRDKQVPISQAYLLRDALQDKNKSNEFIEITTDNNGQHFFYHHNNVIWEKIDEFLKKYL